MRPELRNYIYERRNFNLRLVMGLVLVLVLFGVLVVRFYYLQVNQYKHYQTLAERNRISIVPIVPTRGAIFDRNGKALAENLINYSLEISVPRPQNVDGLLDELAKIVTITPYDRKRYYKRRNEYKSFESVPIRTNLSDEEAARFAVNHFRFPDVKIKSRLYRHYPFKEVGAHVVGYIARINDRDLTRLEAEGIKSNYKGSDHIGKAGIEEFYESRLHGTTGFQQIEIDADGRSVRPLKTNPAIPGENITLTLDMNLQAVAEQAFGDQRGALVAIEPKTGEMLAYVSKPSYDLNLFVGGIDYENWNRLNNSIDRPLVNRPIRGRYPAASTFKPFMSLAGLKHELRRPPYRILDRGYFSLPKGQHRYRDWARQGHGYVDMARAIVISCDTFFYGLALELGIQRIAEYVSHFGFGRPTNIDLEGEKSGLLPTPEWKKARYKKPWYKGDTVIVGIGQGYMLITPMQLAQATATLANRGVSMKPHFAMRFEDPFGKKVETVNPKIQDSVTIPEEDFNIVENAMIHVTLPGGTARTVGTGAPYRVAGKTGTAQVVGIKQNARYDAKTISERNRDHALFIAYAPVSDPKMALAIIVENGEHGGSTAGPIARTVFDYYLLGKKPPVTKPAEPAPQAAEH